MINYIVTGYQCHLIKCTQSKDEDPEGCTSFQNQGVMSYKDQLKRDYPSFSQIRSVINENSKFTYLVTFWYILKIFFKLLYVKIDILIISFQTST